MRIVDLLKKDAVALNAKVSSKDEMLDLLIDLHEKVGNISDKKQFKEGIMKRESEGPTAIADGICIPHSKNAAVKEPGIAAITVPGGVDCDALDGQPSNLFFMIAAPAEGSDVHLEALSRLSTILMDAAFREKLLTAESVDAFLKAIDEKETEKYGAEEESAAQEEKPEAPASTGYRVLAVTACPTGIAHTYMAAEALEEKGKELGIPVKAETNGSSGAKNVLTKEEIAACDGIIIAADKNVEMARFDGKPLIKVKVSDGIHKSQELIEKVVNGEAPIYHHHGGADNSSAEDDGEGIGHQIYKHLMNGVSHMLPFVIGGGILIAIAFLLDDYSIDPANFGMNTPVAAFFKTAGNAAFGFMLPILAGYIAMSIADRPGLMVGFVGGFLANAGTTFASAFDSSISPISGGFLGALFAGFVAGYLVLLLQKATEKLPASMDGIRPMLIYPVIGLLGISVIMLAINPFFSWLNQLLSDALNSLGGANSIILGLVVAGMMSIDMGGPFNKAAYVFGTAALASQADSGYMIMAAVMVGGMVPPIAIAIASWAFKNKFTDNDRKAAPVNAIMGLCFISEAAIPYAAGDPLHVIPSCVVGSAVSGALSMAFGCTLMAPHGGIFVFPVVGNALMYIVALLIGSIVGAVLLGVLRKPAAK
ncbi:MAG TPA: fructose-specific PTS transporter subunit EIIC [Candidatus Anaerobutyricum stercoripullorum]|uniref:Fructose-specific PTS transporter subunit EIIC n=1 Tax=Candidatus Anaerobutyricum stercoripullorum TaxID=2838456 RepID=A0A9D1X4C9_9FIRM|nr:fructose-specific PTS transporter subunit EIIC [Candidatus Anaerobutyricum stercoripullorum]